MIELRQLDKEDYDVLETVAEGYKPSPDSSIVVLALDNEEIVGRTMIVAVAHIEGTWVAPRCRRAFIGKRLISALEQAARDSGLTKLFAYTNTEENGAYMKRLGYTKAEIAVWEKNLTCQS